MTTQEVKRKLTAILSADVKGYSRLMGEDEEWTVHTVNTYKDIMSGLIQQHRGRVVDAPGDNVLAEFASVVDAVQCAVEIQQVLRAKNAMLPENRRMEFRIGINLGDVIEERDTIYGDGVNIAARLESLSEAGGVCVSGTAFDQVENKLGLRYEYLGEQTVKNIAKPVRVYRVLMETEAVAQRGLEVASKEKMAFPLPDLPSIAVLPFENMSGDPKQEFLSDGITETIITALSKVPNLFVIARNSTFTYKGKPVKVKQVSEELGVRYVLEGSFQRSGDRIRITAQLIDALTGHHLWAEHYDRDLTDIFALQDEITMKILAAIQVKLTAGEDARLRAKGTKNLEAYLKLMQARQYMLFFNKENYALARQLTEQALALDPHYAAAYATLCRVQMMEVTLGVYKNPREALEQSAKLGEKAITLDDSNALAHAMLTPTYVWLKEHDKAIAEAEKAVSLDPNSAFAYFVLGSALDFAGRSQEAIPFFKKSLRLSPIPIDTATLVRLGSAYRQLGQYEESVASLKKALQLYGADHFMAHLWLAATYASMGREKEARAEAAEVLRIDPTFSVDSMARRLPYKDQKAIDDSVSAWRKAGLK
jgi:adenylate cyclase